MYKSYSGHEVGGSKSGGGESGLDGGGSGGSLACGELDLGGGFLGGFISGEDNLSFILTILEALGHLGSFVIIIGSSSG